MLRYKNRRYAVRKGSIPPVLKVPQDGVFYSGKNSMRSFPSFAILARE